jgi:DNA-binding CsgD family transcriptional regulator
MKNRLLKNEIKKRRALEFELKRKKRELEIKLHELNELNSALRILLKQRDEDKREIEEKVMANVKTLLMPWIEKLKRSSDDHIRKLHLSVLESNLEKIISPLSQRLCAQYLHMTPREIQVSYFIREGKTTKEIAEFMGVSHSAVDLHRYHIRGKLGLKNRKISLRAYLLSLS